MKIDVIWPEISDESLLSAVHRVFHAVVELGGAVGYLQPPTRAQIDPWVEQALAAAAAGDAALALVQVDGTVEAMGLWRRASSAVFAHSAVLEKIMAHPSARGLGLGERVVSALIDSARDAGIETLTLGVRGNNHGAIELYERLGFRECGRVPNSIEVGLERFDDVRMYVDLGRAPGVVLRGAGPGGPGSSPGSRARA